MNKKTIILSPTNSIIWDFFEKEFNLIGTDFFNTLMPYESYHADMQALNIDGNIFINSKCNNLIEALKSKNISLIPCENIGYKYPENVALNAALIGRKLLCKESALHPNVRNYCNENNIEIINVNQGYAKCSTLVLNENSIITDDESIYAAAIKNNINVLKIDKGDIYIDNITTGFIGGASTVINNKVYFLGDIIKHRNYSEILDFININKLTYQCICISKDRLIDIGSIIII